jgi:exodeoxyribonuclease VII small subunit
MSDKKTRKSGEPSYAEASSEIEAILAEIESGEIDLDVLSERVERAATLLALCRSKLAATETRVRKVVAELDAAPAADDAGAAEDDEQDER